MNKTIQTHSSTSSNCWELLFKLHLEENNSNVHQILTLFKILCVKVKDIDHKEGFLNCLN
jgi:hypothetical protein